MKYLCIIIFCASFISIILMGIYFEQPSYYYNLDEGIYNQHDNQVYKNIEVASIKDCENICTLAGLEFYLGGIEQAQVGCFTYGDEKP